MGANRSPRTRMGSGVRPTPSPLVLWLYGRHGRSMGAVRPVAVGPKPGGERFLAAEVSERGPRQENRLRSSHSMLDRDDDAGGVEVKAYPPAPLGVATGATKGCGSETRHGRGTRPSIRVATASGRVAKLATAALPVAPVQESATRPAGGRSAGEGAPPRACRGEECGGAETTRPAAAPDEVAVVALVTGRGGDRFAHGVPFRSGVPMSTRSHPTGRLTPWAPPCLSWTRGWATGWPRPHRPGSVDPWRAGRPRRRARRPCRVHLHAAARWPPGSPRAL